MKAVGGNLVLCAMCNLTCIQQVHIGIKTDILLHAGIDCSVRVSLEQVKMEEFCITGSLL